MTNNDIAPEEDFFEQYDELATDICADTQPNFDLDLEQSNEELCHEICDLEDVDHFDLFDDLDPEATLKSDDPAVVRATAFKYLLRYQTFSTAETQGIGDETFNALAIAHSELWYIRLTDRYVELHGGAADKTWVN